MKCRIWPPNRWLRILVAATVGPGLVIVAALGGPARADVPKNAPFKSAIPQAQQRFGKFIIDNEVLNAEAGPQTIWAYSYRRWGVESTQAGTASVKSYPCVKSFVRGSPQYSSMHYLRSTFTESMPATNSVTASAAYTVWLNGHNVEVTMWVDNHNRRPTGHRIGEIAVYKDEFIVRQDSPTAYTFVLSGPQETTGTVHLLSALRWLVNHRRLNSTDSVDEVDFGWQIASTAGTTQNFHVTAYKVSSGRKLPPKTPPPTAGSGFNVRWTFLGGVAVLFVAMFMLAMLMLGKLSRAGRDRTLTGMFNKYGPRHQQAPIQKEPEPDNNGKMATAAVSAVNSIMPSTTQERLARRLDLAGVSRKPAEWALLGGLLGVVIAATLSLVTSYVLLGVLAGAVIGWLTMRMSLSVRILRRRASFSDQLPDILQLIASTLQAGFSLPQALDAVVREQGQPAAGEFSRALAEARLGARLEDGLDAVATRMESDDLHWTVMTIRIQQGVGGNLAEVLLTIANTIRERAAMRSQVRALSAEGRLSAYILVALPIIVATWLFITSGPYMRPLYTTTMGEILLGLAVALIVIGALVMRKMIKVEV
ncbi:MAG: type II secretion system F family protein [Streptosporangiaceae bacterium]